MAFDIPLTDLTNKTAHSSGTGVYDVLMKSVSLNIDEQFNSGRITGAEYAQVYLGSLQAVLAESVRFILSEKNIGLLELQKRKLQEEIDLIIAQTASQYEQIAATKADTNRRNLMNSKEVVKVERETALITRQESELALTGAEERLFTIEKRIATTSGGLDNTNKTNAEVAFINARELETEASTVRQDNESAEKVLLMQAQTNGFRSDAKQKLMKQLFEGYAINTTTTGSVSAPPVGSAGASLDAIANEILDDWNSAVNI